MENNIKIGRWEAIAILINSICMQIFLNFPRAMAESAGTAGWILSAYVSLLTFVAFFIIVRLYKPFEGMDIIDIAQYAAGSFGRITISLLILAQGIMAVSVILREYGEDMKVIALTVSPISFVLLFFVAGMVAAVYFGIESIARMHAFAVPIIASGFMLIVIGLVPDYKVYQLLPILGNGADEIFIKGASKISVYSALILLYLIVPFMKSYRDFRSVGYVGIGMSAFFLILSSAVYLMVVPYPIAIENFLPIYQLARLIEFGRFFQRIEPIFMLIWAAAALMYLSTAFFFNLYQLKKTFGLKYYRPLILAVATLIFNFSLLPKSLMSAVNIEVKYFRVAAWVTTFAAPIIILIIARIKKAAEGGNSEK